MSDCDEETKIYDERDFLAASMIHEEEQRPAIPRDIVMKGSKFRYCGKTVDLYQAYKFAFQTNIPPSHIRFLKSAKKREKIVKRMGDVLSGNVEVPDIASFLGGYTTSSIMKRKTLLRLKNKYDVFSHVLGKSDTTSLVSMDELQQDSED